MEPHETQQRGSLELTLGEMLRVIRERAHLTQGEVGQRLEMGRNTINRYEADGSVPRWRDVEQWALECGHQPAILRRAWESARESGWIYEVDPNQPSLFDLIADITKAEVN